MIQTRSSHRVTDNNCTTKPFRFLITNNFPETASADSSQTPFMPIPSKRLNLLVPPSAPPVTITQLQQPTPSNRTQSQHPLRSQQRHQHHPRILQCPFQCYRPTISRTNRPANRPDPVFSHATLPSPRKIPSGQSSPNGGKNITQNTSRSEYRSTIHSHGNAEQDAMSYKRQTTRPNY